MRLRSLAYSVAPDVVKCFFIFLCNLACPERQVPFRPRKAARGRKGVGHPPVVLIGTSQTAPSALATAKLSFSLVSQHTKEPLEG
jgi:hypothetical protein